MLHLPMNLRRGRIPPVVVWVACPHNYFHRREGHNDTSHTDMCIVEQFSLLL
jgi:hypothetical protein